MPGAGAQLCIILDVLAFEMPFYWGGGVWCITQVDDGASVQWSWWHFVLSAH